MTYNWYGIGNFKTGAEDEGLKDRQLYFLERVFPERNITGTTKEVKSQTKRSQTKRFSGQLSTGSGHNKK